MKILPVKNKKADSKKIYHYLKIIWDIRIEISYHIYTFFFMFTDENRVLNRCRDPALFQKMK